ncbi:MAG: ATP-binding protein [Acidimicrobiales bacterium]
MSWSSGKDSAMALEVARSEGAVEVTALLSTVNADADRVAMHAVRRSLLEAQADRLGLRLVTVEIPSPCSNEAYEARMAGAIAAARADGVSHVIFGDLFLRDVRAYREDRLKRQDISPIFPLWARPTDVLAREMLATGLKAVITCVDPTQLPREFAGRAFDVRLLSELPPGVDPCGERGEFHTFVWDGPGFRSPIEIEVGQVVERDGFVFCDLTEPEQAIAPAACDDHRYRHAAGSSNLTASGIKDSAAAGVTTV